MLKMLISSQKLHEHSNWFIRSIFIIVAVVMLLRIFVYGLYQVPSSSMETTMLVGERFIADKISYYFRPVQVGDIVTFNDPNFIYSDNSWIKLMQAYFWGPSNWTKRVIGIPGDHIQGKILHGRPVIYRNGRKLDEFYVNSFALIGSCDEDSLSIRFKSFDRNATFEKQPFYSFAREEVEKAQKLCKISDLVIKPPNTISYCLNGRNADVFEKYLQENEYWVMGDNRAASFDSRFWGKSGQSLDGSHIHGRIVFRLLSVDSDSTWLFTDLLKSPLSFFKKIRWSRCFQYVQ
jgi:signal peptidase I